MNMKWAKLQLERFTELLTKRDTQISDLEIESRRQANAAESLAGDLAADACRLVERAELLRKLASDLRKNIETAKERARP